VRQAYAHLPFILRKLRIGDCEIDELARQNVWRLTFAEGARLLLVRHPLGRTLYE